MTYRSTPTGWPRLRRWTALFPWGLLFVPMLLGIPFHLPSAHAASQEVEEAEEVEGNTEGPTDLADPSDSADPAAHDTSPQGSSPNAAEAEPISPLAKGKQLQVSRVTVGLGNHWKIGHWTSVRIELQSTGEAVQGSLTLTLPDGDGFPVRYGHDPNQIPFDIPAGSTESLQTYVRMARPQAEMEIRIDLPEGETLRQRLAIHENSSAISSTRHWIMQLGGDLELDRVLRRRRSQVSEDIFSTAITDFRSLPSEWFGYEGVQTIVLMTSQAALLEQLDQPQREALRQWVRLGGRLIYLAGSQGARLHDEGGPLAELIPGNITGTTEQSVAAGLEAFARADQPLGPFVASLLESPRGRIEAFMEGRAQASQPAIVRGAHGFGEVVFLAFDLDQPPFRGWAASEEILRTILLGSPQSREGAMREEASRRVTHFGYDELAGQLRSALDAFPAIEGESGVRMVSFFTVAAILACYVVCVSAGDYFVLRKLFGRMVWTWVTFPVVVITFSIALVMVSEAGRGGAVIRSNQVDLVDVDLVDGTVRGTNWTHLYSPVTRGHDFQAEPVWTGLSSRLGDVSPEFRGLMAWQGLPGWGLGGMDQTANETQFPVTYDLRSDAPPLPQKLISGLPITAGSTRSLLTRWWSFPELTQPEPLTSDRDGFLHGVVVNPFDFPLEDALLAHDRWSYRIDRPIQPGESLLVDGLQRRDLEWRLTRRRAMHGKTSYTSTPWEVENREVERIVEMMMFHEAAGGRGYTDLNQKYQDYIDLSEHLFLGRAILVGRVAQPGMELTMGEESLTDQADRRWTWYRLILPVEYSATMATERFLP